MSVSEAVQGEIKQTVSAPVVVEAPLTLALNFEVGGKVKNVYVSEGEAVKKGDLLAELENEDLVTALDQASAQTAAAQAAVEIAKENQKIANSAVSIANSNIQKLKNGLTSAQLAVTEAQLAQAAQTVEDAEANLEATENLTEETKKQAELTVEAAEDAADATEAGYDQAKDRYKKYPNPVTKFALDSASAAWEQAKSAVEVAEQTVLTAEAQNQQALTLSNAQVNAAKGTYKVVQAQYNAQKSPPRVEDLNIANQTVEQAQAQSNIASAQLSSASEQLLVLESQKQLASRRVTKSMLIAPTDGLIVNIGNKEGELVGASSGLGSAAASSAGSAGGLSALSLSSAASSAGSAFIVLIDLSNIDVIADVDETDIAKVQRGMTADVNLDAFIDAKLQGKVTAISRTSKTSSTGGHVFETTIHVDKGSYDISQGMTGDTEILLEERTGIVTIPFESVFKDGDSSYVFVMSKSVAIKKQIELGVSNDTEYQVLSGIKAGDKVIVSGLEDLKDGQRVREEKAGETSEE